VNELAELLGTVFIKNYSNI